MSHLTRIRQIATCVVVAMVMALHPLTALAQTGAPVDGDHVAATSSQDQSQPAPVSDAKSSEAPPAILPKETPPSEPASQSTAPASTPTTQEVLVKKDTKPERVYTLNKETGRWDSDKWEYNPITRKYEPATKLVVTSTAEKAPEKAKDGVAENNSSASDLKAISTADIQNILNSTANSGAASVKGNTTAANAMSGDAAAIATIMNSVNSSVTNSDNSKAATFVTDVVGDVNGDIILKPMLLKAMLEAGAEESSSASAQIKNTSSLTNDINLTAKSGDASVTKNTTAGDATTGSANTVANVVNVVNSLIAANQSFVGTVNIYGNLNGDILIAPDFIPQLLASNAPTSSSLSAPPNKTIKVDTENTQKIINNVNLNAMSGNAVVAGNTKAGSATTGAAETNTVIFNMTGHEIIAKNSLLVFINVLGSWVGVIVDAPTGATSAMLGNGVAQSNLLKPDLSITAENDVAITNNLDLSSLSGNALVAGNTLAGNARSGNATASANIANISNSQFGLSDWFGILYINVFGSWLGSFGVDTEYGNQPAKSSSGVAEADKPIEFVPKGAEPLSIEQIVPLITGHSRISAAGSQLWVDEAISEGGEPEIVAAAYTGGGGRNIPAVANEAQRVDTLGWIAALSFLGGASLLGNSYRRGRQLSVSGV